MYDRYSMPGSGATGTGEWLDLAKSWAAVSLAFAIFIQPGHFVFELSFLINLLIAGVTCGIGFVLHELAHRVVARYYGAEAHFVASPTPMLVLPILVAFVGWFLAAPGAVWHRGHLTERQLGLVALAGPVTNLVIAFVFFGLLAVGGGLGLPLFWLRVLSIGYTINAWLGLFNMIPVDPFDGGKIIRWSKVAFGVTIAVAVFTVFVLPQIF